MRFRLRCGLAALIATLPVWLAARPAVPAVPAVPVIVTFKTARTATGTASPWTTDFLQWSVTGATSVSIDQGIGAVSAASSTTISPTTPTKYTLTATNASGTVTASLLENYIPLVQIGPSLYKTEHSVYYIADPAQVSYPDYNSVLSLANIDNLYLPQLKSVFSDDFMMVVIAANHLSPNNVPSVITRRHLADGIGDNAIVGVGVPNLCRYNIGGGSVITGALAIFDHEIGHNWAARLGTEVAAGHWYPNATVHGQMSDNYFTTINGTLYAQQIDGNPTDGFTWSAVDNTLRNNTEIFADQDLYLMGLNAVFPDTYVLTNPVLNADHTVSSSAVNTYGQSWIVAKDGARAPSYRTSDKQFRIGFFFVAANLAEIQDAYLPWELSINHFENAEAIDTTKYASQVPFLVETKFRASINARLSDLDGNATPTLALNSPTYLVSGDGTAAVTYSAADADGVAPTVSLIPAAPEATFAGGNVIFQGLSAGTHFFTLKAEDSLGKKAFAHFVIDVTAGSANLTWASPGAITYGTALSAAQLNAQPSIPGTITYSPAAGTILTPGTGQTLVAQFTPDDTSVFSTASKIVTIDVNKATPAITWSAPAPVVYGSALTATQLNATASVPGTLVYTPAIGTLLGAGAGQTLQVQFTPTDSSLYLTNSASVSIDVLKATPSITWAAPSSIVFGTALSSTQLNATASVPGTLVYTPALGAVLGAGASQTLQVDFTPDDASSYVVNSATVSIDVLKATPSITWAAPSSIVFGTALSSTQLNAAASVPGTLVYTPALGAVLGAGAGQTLQVQFTPDDSSSYLANSASVSIDVAKATPSVTWAPPSPIASGTPLSAAQLNAAASVAGTFIYTPPAGTVLGTGANQTLSVAFAPTDSTDYNHGSATVSITVTGGVAFTDDPLIAGVTVIKTIHLTELRDDINTLRRRFQLSDYAWADANISAGATPIRASHIVELRTALQDVFVAAGVAAPSYTAIAAGGPIAIAHIAEIRAAIAALW